MTLELRIIIVVLAVLASITLMVMFRKYAVYVYVALWLFLPKLGTNLFGIGEISSFSFVELACSITLLLIALQSRSARFSRASAPQRFLQNFKFEGLIIAYLAFMVLSQYCVLMWIPYQVPGLHTDIPSGQIFSSMVRELAGVVFFFACFRLVNNRAQAQQILKLFVIISFCMALELFSVLLISPIENIIGGYSITETGLFNSIFINDYHLVGLIAVIGVLVSIYLYRLEKKNRWLVSCVMSFLVVVFNTQRSLIAAGIVGIGVYLYIAYFQRFSILKRIMCVIVVFLAGFLLVNNVERISGALLDNNSNDLASVQKSLKILRIASRDSTAIRIGVQLRGIEVSYHIFPLGVGPKMSPYYMAGDAPRIFFNIGQQGISDGYHRVADNIVISNTHNGFIEQIISYGFFGFLSLLIIPVIFYRNILKISRELRLSSELYPLLVSVTLSLGTYYLFQGYPRAYIIVFFFIHLSFLMISEGKSLSRLAENDSTSK